MYRVRVLLLLGCLFVSTLLSREMYGAGSEVRETTLDMIDQVALGTVYSGEETLHYSISWSGGVKIGDLYLTVSRGLEPDTYVIGARVTDYGLFKLFYPVDDTFTTTVKGPLKVPVRYEVKQKEGHNDAITHRVYHYDQQRLVLTYQKNRQPVEEFTLEGKVYNEFASFFMSRGLDYSSGNTLIIATFADKKRNEVEVEVVGRERRSSLFGPVDTLKIKPRLNFKGLYDKDGDTVYWITGDECRVPVEINSKIVVGSLQAELMEYSNPACKKYNATRKELPSFEN